MLKRKKILITGSEGFIGSHLIRFFFNKNFHVIACHYKKINKIKSKNINYYRCDVRNRKRIGQILKISKPDLIYHLAAKSLPSFSFNYPIKTMNTNLFGTFNILEECRVQKINPKIIIACSSGQFGSRPLNKLPYKEDYIQKPDHIYGLSKNFQNMLGMQYFKMYNLKIIIALIFNTTGPGKKGDVFSDFCKQFVLNKIKNGTKTIKIGDLNKFRDFLHINDLIKGLFVLGKKGKIGEEYNLCSSNYHQISKIISLMKNKKFKIKVLRDKKLMRKFDERYIFGSNKKIFKLGWEPKLGIKDIFRDICQFYEKKKY